MFAARNLSGHCPSQLPVQQGYNTEKHIGQPPAVPMDVDAPQPVSAAAPAENGATPQAPVKPEPSTAEQVWCGPAMLSNCFHAGLSLITLYAMTDGGSGTFG